MGPFWMGDVLLGWWVGASVGVRPGICIIKVSFHRSAGWELLFAALQKASRPSDGWISMEISLQGERSYFEDKRR